METSKFIVREEGTKWDSKSEWEGDRETDRQKQGQTDRQKQRETDRQKQGQRETRGGQGQCAGLTPSLFRGGCGTQTQQADTCLCSHPPPGPHVLRSPGSWEWIYHLKKGGEGKNPTSGQQTSPSSDSPLCREGSLRSSGLHLWVQFRSSYHLWEGRAAGMPSNGHQLPGAGKPDASHWYDLPPDKQLLCDWFLQLQPSPHPSQDEWSHSTVAWYNSHVFSNSGNRTVRAVTFGGKAQGQMLLSWAPEHASSVGGRILVIRSPLYSRSRHSVPGGPVARG